MSKKYNFVVEVDVESLEAINDAIEEADEKTAEQSGQVYAIVSPQHPLWENFCERLQGVEGCDFKINEKGGIYWKCGRDKSKARAILETMENVDIDGTLKYFDEHGGNCDCEILFNVLGTEAGANYEVDRFTSRAPSVPGCPGVRPSPAEVPDAMSTTEAIRADAARYRWLRSQSWSSTLCVVANPKDAVRIGQDCPSHDRLDEMIDDAMKCEY